MDEAERRVAEGSSVVGLGVGLYADYGTAQRMYVRRGYLPDGAGVVLGGVSVPPGTLIRLDDDPVLMFTKLCMTALASLNSQAICPRGRHSRRRAIQSGSPEGRPLIETERSAAAASMTELIPESVSSPEWRSSATAPRPADVSRWRPRCRLGVRKVANGRLCQRRSQSPSPGRVPRAQRRVQPAATTTSDLSSLAVTRQSSPSSSCSSCGSR